MSSGAINTTSYSSSTNSTQNNNGFKFHQGISRNSSKDLFNHNIGSVKNINSNVNNSNVNNSNNVRKNSGDAIIIAQQQQQQQDIM